MLTELTDGLTLKLGSVGSGHQARPALTYPIYGTDCSLLMDIAGLSNKNDYLRIAAKVDQFPIIVLNFREGLFTSVDRRNFLMEFPGQVAIVCRASTIKIAFDQCSDILFKELIPKLYEVPSFLIGSDYVQMTLGSGVLDTLNEDIDDKMYVAGMVKTTINFGKLL